MLIEISKSTSEACFELLLGWGYQGFVYDGTLQKTSGYLDGRFSNYLFLHPDRAVRIGQLGETLALHNPDMDKAAIHRASLEILAKVGIPAPARG